MNSFGLYFNLGLEHILTWDALDHLLFIAALTLRYQFHDYRKILLLVTAFTIGHCATLILGTMNLINVPSAITEFLITLTIIISAINNLFFKPSVELNNNRYLYVLALLFGLIHGLGFAYGLKSILGKDENIAWQLLAFNIGIEIAQLIIVLVVLTVSFVFIRILQVHFRTWILFTSGMIVALAIQMAIERNPFKNNHDEATVNLSFIPRFYNSRFHPIAVLQ